MRTRGQSLGDQPEPWTDHVAWVRQALEYHGGRADWDELMKRGLGSGDLSGA